MSRWGFAGDASFKEKLYGNAAVANRMLNFGSLKTSVAGGWGAGTTGVGRVAGAAKGVGSWAMAKGAMGAAGWATRGMRFGAIGLGAYMARNFLDPRDNFGPF